MQPDQKAPLANVSGSAWQVVVPTMMMMWVVGQIDKGNLGFVVAYHPFLVQMGLAHRPALIGLLSTAFVLAYGVGMPFWGWLTDRFGPRRTAMVGLILWLAMMVLGAAAQSLTVFLVSRIILGLSEGVLWPACNAMTARWFPVETRSRANAWWINGINIGLGIAGLVTTSLLVVSGWRASFLVIAGFTLVPLAMLSWLTPEKPSRPTAKPDTMRPPLADYRLWVVTVANIATGMGIWGVMAWIPKYLVDVRHFSLSNMGVDISLIWFLCIAVLALMGNWADRIGRRAPFGAVAFLVYGIAITLCTVVPTATLAMIFIAIAVWTLQITTVMVFSLVHGLSPDATVGVSTGVLAGVSNLVASMAPLVMGMLIGMTHSYVGAFGFLGAVALMGAIMMGILVPQRY